MDTVLWIVQAVLALKFVAEAFTHGLCPSEAKLRRGSERLGAAARPLLTVIALGMFAGVVGLVLPAAIRALAWLVPWAGALLAGMTLASIAFHVRCAEKPKVWADLVLCALAAFVAVGRWAIAPL